MLPPFPRVWARVSPVHRVDLQSPLSFSLVCLFVIFLLITPTLTLRSDEENKKRKRKTKKEKKKEKEREREKM